MKTIIGLLLGSGLALPLRIGSGTSGSRERRSVRSNFPGRATGENHPGHAELIVVTEPFLTDPLVKDESGTGDSVDVLKLNALTTFNTGLYSYRTMTSFLPLHFLRPMSKP